MRYEKFRLFAPQRDKYLQESSFVGKVIDMLTQDVSHEAFQMLLERYNKCIAAAEDYFEGF